MTADIYKIHTKNQVPYRYENFIKPKKLDTKKYFY